MELREQKISEQLNLPTKNDLTFNNLFQAIKQQDEEKLKEFFSEIGYAQMGKTFGLPPEIISNFFDPETLPNEIELLRESAIELLAQKYNLDIIEIAPKELKKMIVGDGSASKEQIKKILKISFKKDFKKSMPDTLDAMSLALVGFYLTKQKKLLEF